MLLIFGTKVRTSVLRAIAFACPACRADRTGVVVQLRRWFTLFFIPVIPMGKLGEAVRCDTCGTTFRPDVLDRPTMAATDEAHVNAVRALCVLVVGAGDPANAAMRAQAVATIGSLVPGYLDATLATDLPVIERAHAAQYVAPLALSFDPARGERFLGELVRVASAGGDITEDQRALLHEVGHALGLSSAHVTGIVATAGGVA